MNVRIRCFALCIFCGFLSAFWVDVFETIECLIFEIIKFYFLFKIKKSAYDYATQP